MNDKTSKAPLSGSLCALLALGLALPAIAQQTVAEGEAVPDAAAATPAAQEPAAVAAPDAQAGGASDDIGEVIVTARRIEEKLQDVPISITVFNQDQLSDLNVTSATDLAAFTPGRSLSVRYDSTRPERVAVAP